MIREKVTLATNPVVSSYLPLVDFLSKLLGPHCEVVLHDLSVPERSVVAIANGDVSGRAVGAPLTDFALRLIKEKTYASADFLHGYDGSLKCGKTVRSSTFFIKDGDALVGMLCFNMDMTHLQNLQKDLSALLTSCFSFNGLLSAGLFGGVSLGSDGAAPAAETVAVHETFSESIEELMASSIAKVLAPYGLPPERLSPVEREGVVEALYKKGFFQLRGAVEHIADAFGLSEATIYRYLKNVQKKG